ncbi:MAG: lysylphosphatidylglycerol synthase transmembrane domain-containing protein [Candidatus Nealsonbacteria bacterium]
MKKILSFFVSLLIGIGLLAWIIRLVGWQEILSSFLIFTGWQGMVILFLSFLLLWVSCFKWHLILKSQGYEIKNRELFLPYLTSFAMNYLFQMIIVGGDIFRAYVLREKYDVPWKKAVSSVIIDKILDSTGFILAILTGLGFFLFKIGLPPANLAIVLGGFLLLMVSGISFFYLKSFRKESIARPIAKFFRKRGLPDGDILEIERETFSYFKPNKTIFWQGIGLSLLRVSLTWLRTWLLILFLGQAIGVWPTLSILGSVYIAMMIPIPADIGVHEVVQVFTFNSLGLGATIAPAFAIIQRGAQLILSLAGIVIFFKLGMGLFKSFLFKKLDTLINGKI